ncbi:MAG: hypothetical protein JRI87_10865 [Deltaproteobacteria bacterium]|nr:hypothetical protein [Deltaproteobacteria bacterium]
MRVHRTPRHAAPIIGICSNPVSSRIAKDCGLKRLEKKIREEKIFISMIFMTTSLPCSADSHDHERLLKM